MSQALLGETIDIHGGGLDLQFPHHENELAQSESATGKEFARLWMHNGLLKMGTAKMAGSVGNVVNIADLLARHSPETVRFLLLSTHYRSPIEYSEERLNEIAKSLQSFYRLFERYQRIYGNNFYDLPSRKGYVPLSNVGMGNWAENPIQEFESLRNIFIAWMDSDFNTAGATAVLHDLVNLLNKVAEENKLDEPGTKHRGHEAFHRGMEVLRELSHILGLFWMPPEEATLGGDDTLVAGLMQLLIDLRNNLRAEAKKIAAKDDSTKKALFAQTDLIRQRLGELNVVLEDRPGGTTWRRA